MFVSGVNKGFSKEQPDSSVAPGDDSLDQISSTAQKIITSEDRQIEDETLESFLDPVTFELMEDPVITSSGRSYERSTIKHIINYGDGMEPFTREPLTLSLIPNRALKNAIEQWKKSSLLTKERSNQIIRKAQEVKKREKEKNDAINEFHEELFAQKPEGHFYVKELDSSQEEESKKKEEMREMQQQMERITGSEYLRQSNSSSSVMAAAPRIPKVVNLPRIAFGKDDWERYFGKVEDIPLPPNMEEILQGPCPIWEGRKMEDTHMLTLIPQSVDGRPLTLNYLRWLIQRPKGGGHATKCKCYSVGKHFEYETSVESLGDQTIKQSYWAFMTKDLLPHSRDKTYKDLCAMVEGLRKRTGINYELPPVLEAAASLLMHHARTGEKLYPAVKAIYTRCQEGYQWSVGGFSMEGLQVGTHYDHYEHDLRGVAGFRKFY